MTAFNFAYSKKEQTESNVVLFDYINCSKIFSSESDCIINNTIQYVFFDNTKVFELNKKDVQLFVNLIISHLVYLLHPIVV